MNNPETRNEIRMDTANLYREEVFTDNTVGTLRRLLPVTADGETDPSRPVQFVGSTQVLTNAGPLPLTFEIQAATLTEAAAAFGDAATDAFEKTMEELREYQRQQAMLPPEQRTDDFSEVTAGLSEQEARFEAARCYSCGNCFECDGCFGACPEDAVIRLGRGKRYRIDYDLCTGCQACVLQCPCNAMEMVPMGVTA